MPAARVAAVLLGYLAGSEDQVAAQLQAALAGRGERIHPDQQAGRPVPGQLDQAEAHEAQADHGRPLPGGQAGPAEGLGQVGDRLADGVRGLDAGRNGQDSRRVQHGQAGEPAAPEPGDQVALGPAARVPARRHDPADDLVAEPDGIGVTAVRALTPRGQVRGADATGYHLDEDLAVGRPGSGTSTTSEVRGPMTWLIFT